MGNCSSMQRSPSTTPSTTPRSRSRFISRLASPFAHKSRNLADFYIEIDDPHRQYSPGDLVSGCLNVKVAKPVRITHVIVRLHGFVQVYKNPGSPPADGYRAHVGTTRGSKNGEYFGNGFASLFEDEVILCGDGKLEVGVYQFQFNLEFPDRDLPSSISFERGTISYMITATLTKPVQFSPTVQCDHKVYLVERIDISQLLPPKARTITLEAISRRSRARTQARKLVDASDRKSNKDGSGTHTTSDQERRESQSSSSPSRVSLNVADHPQSPARSDVSLESLMSSTGRPSHQESNATSPRPSEGERVNGSRISLPNRTITATVESLHGGCLRGDFASVRVHVNHTKHVKSLHGVIITLYRSARVDMHPAIPLGPTEKGKEGKYEDYYPKSTTGLGGLSLSGAGSSHMFRKDLTQTIVPLIINPLTLTAEVTGKVHVPEECFPTISTVPGAMISFRYYIEVVLDIQGKLSSQDRNMSNLGGLASTIAQGQGGDNMVDTATVRRDKGVVACTFELIVGTKDSARKKGKQRQEPVPESEVNLQTEPDTQPGAPSNPVDAYQGNDWQGNGNDYAYEGYDPHYLNHSQYAENGAAYSGYNGYNTYGYNGYDQWVPPDSYQVDPPAPIPIPAMEDESQLSEKEQLRRAEARLLPSEPPGADDDGAGTLQQGTAPYLPDEHVNGIASSSAPSMPSLLTPPAYGAGPSDSRGLVHFDVARNIPLPRTPQYELREQNTLRALPERSTLTLTPSRSNAAAEATDDKQELERRHLQAEASAPPMSEAESSTQASNSLESSAPILSDEELYGDGPGLTLHDSHADASASSELPRYER